MNVLKKICVLIRLLRIEKATGFKLSRKQRTVVMGSTTPCFYGYGRRTGKTTMAVIWTLLWRKEPVSRQRELWKTMDMNARWSDIPFGQGWRKPAIPDPDAFSFGRMEHTLLVYKVMSEKCLAAGIKVAKLTK